MGYTAEESFVCPQNGITGCVDLVARTEATIPNFIRAVNFWHGNCFTCRRGAWAARVKQAGFAEANLMHWTHPVLGNVHLNAFDL